MIFPTTAVLDNFNRSDSHPMTGWTDIVAGFDADGTVTAASSNAQNISLWTSTGPFTDCEVYVTITAVSVGTYNCIFARSTINCSQTYYLDFDGSNITIEYWNGGPTVLATYSQVVSSGDSIGLSCIGTTLTAYYKSGSNAWRALGSITNGWLDSGYIGFESYTTAQKFDNFGGGACRIQAISDNFNDNSVGSLWFEYEAEGVTISETGGQIKLVSTANQHNYGVLGTNQPYDLTNSYATIKVVDVGAQGEDNIFGPLMCYKDDDNDMGWQVEDGNLQAFKKVATSSTELASTTFNLATHRYLRLRANTTTVYWDYSADGITWTNFTSTLISSLFAITALKFEVLCTNWGTVNPSDTYIADDFNVINVVQTATNFWNNTYNETLWYIDVGGNSTGDISGRRLLLTVETAGDYVEFVTDSYDHDVDQDSRVFDLDNSSMSVEIIEVSATTNCVLRPIVLRETSWSNVNELYWQYEGTGVLRAYKKLAGTPTVLKTVTYSATQYRYLRIREAEGIIYFEYSSDKFVWVHFCALTSPFTSISQLQLAASAYTDDSSYSYMYLDEFSTGNTHLFKDNFNDNSVDTVKWTASAFVDEVNNELEFTTILAGTSGGLTSDIISDLTSSWITTKIIDLGDLSLYEFHFVVWKSDYGDSVQWVISGSTIETTHTYSTTYNANTFRYLRIREAVGIIYYDSSTDGINWTNRDSEANSFDMTSVLGAYYIWSGEQASTTTGKVDDFNVINVSQIATDFNDNSYDSDIFWKGSHFVTQNGQLELYTDTADGSDYFFTWGGYDIRDSIVSIKVVDAGNQEVVNWGIWFYLEDSPWTGSHTFRIREGRLTALYSGTSIGEVDYVPSVHKYLRFKEMGDVIHYDFSANGVHWVNLAIRQKVLDTTAVHVVIACAWDAESAGGGDTQAKFDDLCLVKIEQLRDNFNDNSVDTDKWINEHATQVIEISQHLEITSTTSVGTYDLKSKVNYDLTDSQVSSKVIDVGNQSLTTWEVFPVYLCDTGNEHTLEWMINTNQIYARIDGGSSTYTDYVANTFRYLRIRESSGIIYWDYSTDGTSWANFKSGSATFDVTSTNIRLRAQTYDIEASVTTCKIDNLNITSYSRTYNYSLPTNDTELDTNFTEAEVVEVESSNDVYVTQSAQMKFPIFQFRNYQTTAPFVVNWEGKSGIAPSECPVILEIYNYTTLSWEELTRNDTANENEDFILRASVQTPTDYKESWGFSTCRVYQDVIISSSSSSSSCRSSSSCSSSCRSSSSSSSSSSSCRSSSSSSSSCRSSSSSSSSRSSSSSSSSRSSSSSSSSCRSSSSSSSSSSLSSSSSSSSSRSSSSSSSRSSSSSSSSSCRSSSSSSSSASPCWIAAEIYGEDYTKPETWKDIRTLNARNYIQNIAPDWLRKGYIKYGERIAGWLHIHPYAKIFVRPLIKYFSFRGATWHL